MATANFRVKNARAIYAVKDDEDVLCRREIVEETFPYDLERWADNDTRVICETDDILHKYGNTDFVQIYVCSEIHANAGYYEGCNFDYDIKINYGENYALSDYRDEDDFAEQILYLLENDVPTYGRRYGWNEGLFACNRAKIKKWLNEIILAEIEKCEKACAELCDEKLFCVAVCSNDEAFYQKAN